MTTENSPVCLRHGGEVKMRLRTMHSENSRPGQVTGLYECPECGSQRRLPMDLQRGEVA